MSETQMQTQPSTDFIPLVQLTSESTATATATSRQPAAAAAATEHSKLTVPQLKALCKERKIVGYSKLGKAALLEKLAPRGAPAGRDGGDRDDAASRKNFVDRKNAVDGNDTTGILSASVLGLVSVPAPPSISSLDGKKQLNLQQPGAEPSPLTSNRIPNANDVESNFAPAAPVPPPYMHSQTLPVSAPPNPSIPVNATVNVGTTGAKMPADIYAPTSESASASARPLYEPRKKPKVQVGDKAVKGSRREKRNDCAANGKANGKATGTGTGAATHLPVSDDMLTASSQQARRLATSSADLHWPNNSCDQISSTLTPTPHLSLSASAQLAKEPSNPSTSVNRLELASRAAPGPSVLTNGRVANTSAGTPYTTSTTPKDVWPKPKSSSSAIPVQNQKPNQNQVLTASLKAPISAQLNLSSKRSAGTKRPAAVSSSAFPLNETRKKPKVADKVAKNSQKENIAFVGRPGNSNSSLATKLSAAAPPVATTPTLVPSITNPSAVTSQKTLGTLIASMPSSSAVVSSSSSRFRPLVPVQRKAQTQVASNGGIYASITTAASVTYLDFHSVPLASLQPITLPPSLSQRKRIQAWSVILSGLSDQERRRCVLVSRAIRYAVYLSAIPIISRRFGGRRFAQLSQRYNMSMTNFWPYLNHVQLEHDDRKKAYEASFLPHYFGNWNPISSRLWGSPDHDKQLVIALRFIMTRLWFTISVHGCKDGEMKRSLILDVREIVKNEIWSVTVDTGASRPHGSPPTWETFYVLESTCEAIGLAAPPASEDLPGPGSSGATTRPSKTSLAVRADWSDYVEHRLLPPGFYAVPPPPLLSHLRWTNAEEYDRGIGKLWLARVAKEGGVGEYKKKVAERYVMACVVGNSISGRWMSSNHMAQVFAGTASSDLPVTSTHKKETPKVNLFLPAHHLVESLHFSTSRGEALHPALAGVQTPSREYFILRDNGMEVGCEEDGVWPVWMALLRCDARGIKLCSD